MNKNLLKGVVIGAAVMFFLTANQGWTAGISLNPIKPVPNQPPMTDEQQAIMAVRAAKAWTVNIVGTTNPVPGGVVSNEEVDGTGIIYSSDGYIITNNHVVDDTTMSYTVIFADGTEYPAKIIGLDQYSDVALLKINATGLPTATMGNSDDLETGQTVFAIGNSLGKYQNTVTKGVVSALGRSVDVDSTTVPRLQDLIQTDASINPGNSGGPLIDLDGEVVGINTLVDKSGAGLGFSIPINSILSAVQQLQNFGKVTKSYFGVTFATITRSLQVSKNLSIDQGAYIASVVPGGPADAAGLQAGDIVTAINHEQLTQNNELDTVVSKYPAGTQVLVTYNRNGQTSDTPLILGVFK